MGETFHEDMQAHLAVERQRVNKGKDAVVEMERLGSDLTVSGKRGRVATAKAACGHTPCPVADNYKGNPRPPEPTPAAATDAG